MDSLHSLSAALKWLEIAAEDLWRRKTWWEGAWAAAGPLWREIVDAEDVWGEQDERKYSEVTVSRWRWWAARLDELAVGNMIDDESKSLARASAETIRSLERDWMEASDETESCG
ncbi:unnamed protein product [Aureobasidium mustum]|uniref:Uncharacterized protein n=1 Tax=Aureobasidium mustum TaxID=2773714 RepID=A0A9N8K8D6_9PEZI|nr:unnamed protein product [Aureobasidium mustum]